MRPRPAITLLALLGLLLALAGALVAGCGSEEGFPPAAEPADGPPLSTKPAGKVIELSPGEAEGVAVDPQTGVAAVGLRDPDKLYLVSDPLSPKPKLRKLEIPESPRHMQLAAPGGPILTSAERTDDLIEISLPGGQIKTVKVGDYPHDVAEAANGKIFVAAEGGDVVSVVEGGATVANLPAPEQPGGIEASADGSVIAVVAVAERVFATYDPETLEKLGQVDAGVGPTHLIAGNDDRFYVTDTEGDAILVFTADPEPKLVDRLGVPDSPYGIAIDNERDRLWVTRTGANEVTEFELTDLAPRRLRSFPTVRQPNTVAVDPETGYVYVAGRDAGVLQVFDPDEADSTGGSE